MATASVSPGLNALLRIIRRGGGCVVAALTLVLFVDPQAAWALGSPSDLRPVEPTPRDIEQAAKYFDEGRAAFRNENYIEAAEAFEKADALAPNAKVLLLAIQSRELGGHLARAATLAALAEQRHPKDPLFAEIGDLLKTARDGLHLVTITCESPCEITVGNRLVHGAAATRRFLFLEAGKFRIRASWGDGKTLSKYYEAVNGTRGKLRFSSETEGSEAVGDGAPAQDSAQEPASTASDSSAEESEGGSDDDWGDEEGWGDEQTSEEPATKPPDPEPKAEPNAEGGFEPVVFWSGVAVTGVLVGVSTWSGIDTLQHPGTDTVVAKCVGLGESCPEYQEGLQNQLRTNILWGVTGGVGVITALIGTLWTDWDGTSASPSAAGSQNEQSAQLSFRILPVLTPRPAHAGGGQPTGVRIDGSLLTATGRF